VILRDKPNIFTIAPGAPFLPTLAKSLIDGTLVPGFKADGEPLALAAATIYVPTRRAARALRSGFAQLSGVNAAILPSIRPLGEFEDDFDLPGASLDLLPPVGREERLIQLARMVRQWAEALPYAANGLFGSNPLVLPSTSADAVWLARNLADLMDEAEREGGNWSNLKDLVPQDLANWWQLTLGFMQIVTTHWPRHLAEKGFSDPVAYRNMLIRAEAARLEKQGSHGPVIAAGSTGSMPATADLLKVIARLPNGALVLPGLDKTPDASSWDAIGQADENPSVFGHPQFGLRKLLALCAATRDDVCELLDVGHEASERNAAISMALLPADETGAWINFAATGAGFEHVCEILPASETAEALAIAVALREAVELGHTPAALVTADRMLARRVSAELERFGIIADDSGGTPLEQTPPAALFSLMLSLAFDVPDPAALLSLMQHPLTSLGKDRKTARRSAGVVDLTLLRGSVLPITADAILDHLRTPKTGTAGGDRKNKWIDRFSNDDIEMAAEIRLALCQALEPLQALKARELVSAGEACIASVKAFEAIGLDAEFGLSRLYGGEAGEKFAELLRSLYALDGEFRFSPAEWPAVFRAFISGQAVKPRHGSDPRVFIWGALEARLQDIETVVLGGLNETVWPARPADDPFLSRAMKAKVALDPPERRTGLAAHDFQMLMGHPRVILSRSARREGAPTVPSRWLQRLHALLGADQTKALHQRGQKYLDWAQQIDQSDKSNRVGPPKPKPPLDLRPTHFSVTEIGTLRRDPYAIYARKVLGLEPLPGLIREADARERGNLFHAILERFVAGRTEAPGRLDDLVRIGHEEFASAALPADVHALWWRRFEKTVSGIIEIEMQRAESIDRSIIETASDRLTVDGTRVTLSGRADRIDLLKDGTAAIIDYKSGSSSSAKEAKILLAPQLPLEAALLARGAFKEPGLSQASELAYERLKPNGEVKWEPVANALGKLESAAGLGELAWEKLGHILRHYDNPETAYESQVLPASERKAGEYDHLARVLEWSSGPDAEWGDSS
jgi:ATP-dependent helicase/nuclease subunit B